MQKFGAGKMCYVIVKEVKPTLFGLALNFNDQK